MPLFILLVVSLLIRLSTITAIYSGDVNNHTGWGESILQHSFQGAYGREYVGIMQPTYPPLALYAFTASTGLFDLTNTSVITLNKDIPAFPSSLVWAFENQNVLPAFNKAIAIATDLGVTALLYIFIRHLFPKKKNTALFVAAMYGLNPAVWYISSLWGQIESVPIFWLLLSFYCILRTKPTLASLSFAAALLSKQTAIIFLPIYLIVFLRHFNLRQLLKGVLAQLILFYLVYLPFAPTLNPLWGVGVYINRLQTGSGSVWISDHAFNAWIWYSHLQKIPDSIKVIAGLSAATIGFLAFAVLLALPYLNYFKNRFSWYKTFLLSALTPLIAFCVLTKMHERYSAPTLPFLALLAVYDRRLWFLYVLFSLAHLTNLYHDWYFPRIAGLDTFVASWSAIQLCAAVFLTTAVILLIKSVSKSYAK